jgi:polyisoprenoid-binding protein YceI
MSSLTAPPIAVTGLWTIDSAHSAVRFSVRHHAVSTFRAGFSAITGSYDADAGVLSGTVHVDHAELPGLDRLKAHFLTPDFFDAERHPTLTFESHAVESDGAVLSAKGELTLRGVTKPVTARGTVQGPITVRHRDGQVSERLGIDLATTVDRRDYGVEFNRDLGAGVLSLGWEVAIEVSLELAGASEGA